MAEDEQDVASETPERLTQSDRVPAVWNLPYPRNPNFTGRGRLLADLARAFTGKAPLARVQALVGLGGIGKTQCAVEYCYRHRWDYQVIWWVPSEDSSTLAITFAQLARQLGMKFPPETSLEDIRHVLRRVLSERNDWLIVFDNAQNPDQIRAFLPNTPSGNILVTSRNVNWDELAKPIALAPLTRNESISFLRKRTGRSDASEIAQKLAQALGDLPLALEQAAAVIEQSHITFEEYLARFETHWAELLKQGRKPTDDYPGSIARAWELSFRQLEEASPEAAELMDFCAFLAPEHISYPLLESCSPYVPQKLGFMLANRAALNAAVAALRTYSLVSEFQPRGTTDSATLSGILAAGNERAISIHRLVAGLTRNRLYDATRAGWAGCAVRAMWVLFNFDSNNVSTWLNCGILIPHVLAVVQHAQALDVELSASADLLDTAGRYLHKTAQYTQAREVLTRAMTIYERLCGEKHPKISSVANDLGRVLTRLGYHASAAECFRRALEIDQTIYGHEDPHVATIVNNYGLALHGSGDVETARQQFEWALSVYENHYGIEHPKTASVLNNLGYVVHQLGDVEAARSHLIKALTATQALHGANHPTVASILCNLGSVRRSLGELAQARADVDRALEIDQTAFGTTHPSVARDLEVLGTIVETLGDLQEAKDCYERVVGIHEAIYGPQHHFVARPLNHLARVMHKLGDAGEAHHLMKRAGAIIAKPQSTETPSTAEAPAPEPAPVTTQIESGPADQDIIGFKQ
jgi:tetratricopeptide (TPR) repeat protein